MNKGHQFELNFDESSGIRKEGQKAFENNQELKTPKKEEVHLSVPDPELDKEDEEENEITEEELEKLKIEEPALYYAILEKLNQKQDARNTKNMDEMAKAEIRADLEKIYEKDPNEPLWNR